MTTRILRSTFTVSANASDEALDADITQADLEAAVPVGGSILPLAFILDPEDSDVTCKKLVLKNTKNDEGAYSLVPNGVALTLAGLNKVLSPESGGVSAPALPISHGARLSGTFSNAAASPKTITVLWKVENAILGANVPQRVVLAGLPQASSSIQAPLQAPFSTIGIRRPVGPVGP